MLSSGDIIKERNRSASAAPLSSTSARSVRVEKEIQRLNEPQDRRNSFHVFSSNSNEVLPTYSATFSKSSDNYDEKEPSTEVKKPTEFNRSSQSSLLSSTSSKSVDEKVSGQSPYSSNNLVKTGNLSNISFEDLRDNIKKDKMCSSALQTMPKPEDEHSTLERIPQQVQKTVKMDSQTGNNQHEPQLLSQSSSGRLTAIEQNLYAGTQTGTGTNFENLGTAYTDNRITSNPSISAKPDFSNEQSAKYKEIKPNKSNKLDVSDAGAINAISPPTPQSNSNGPATSSVYTNNSQKSLLNSDINNNQDNLILESVDVMEKLYETGTAAKSAENLSNVQNPNTQMTIKSSDFPSTSHMDNVNEFDEVPFFNENLELEKSKKAHKSNSILNPELYDEADDNQLRSTSVVYNPINPQKDYNQQTHNTNNKDNTDDINSNNDVVEKISTISEEKPVSSNEKKKNNKKFGFNLKNILFIIVAILLIGSISAFIPLIVIFSRGTESTFYKYFDRQSLDMKELLVYSLKDKFNVEAELAKVNFISNIENTGKQFPMKIYPFVNNSVEFYTRANSPQGLIGNYSRDSEIVGLMNYSGLCNVFYGVDYAPKNVIHPVCGINERDVMLDLASLSQVTTKIRTYGMQCNQQSIILDSIQKLGLNMTLSLGVWIGNDESVNDNQISIMKSVLEKYPRELFDSIYIGDEAIFREEKSSDELSEFVNSAKKFIKEDLKWLDLPVGTSEIGNMIDKTLMNSSDIIGANIHPFFSGESVANATKWIFDYVKYQIEPTRQDINATTNIVISEVGWPSGGGNFSDSVAGIDELQKFLNEWIPESHKNQYPWFWFEAFDEPWKEIYNVDGRNWETQWGIFTSDRKLKAGITFPGC